MRAQEESEYTWYPTDQIIQASNVRWLMNQVGVDDYESLHRWSVCHPEAYWSLVLERLQIRLRKPYELFLRRHDDPDQVRWLVGAELNIVDSCFQGDPARIVAIEGREDGSLDTITLGQLDALSNRVANGLSQLGVQPGEPVGLAAPMTIDSVAAYLGLVKLGAVVVGIPDSFSAEEIGVRVRISGARWVITYDEISRGGKVIPLYPRIRAIDGVHSIVIPWQEARASSPSALAAGDRRFQEFHACDSRFQPVGRSSEDLLGILFSSGTTGEPKGIPWTHLCPIKCAADAHFHQDVHPDDVVAWPTSHGWMMGPWLIYSSLLNGATMALFAGAPHTHWFAQFVEKAHVTVLGTVPTLVAGWRNSGCLDGSDWSRLRLISSTGECSRPADMAWLMQKAGGKPIIEYCGGTEIAGGYLGGVVIRPCLPAQFNAKVLGIDFVIVDPMGRPSHRGELFLLPPSIGMSTQLINRHHHVIYYEGCPLGPHGQKLRRHGDEVEQLPNGYWRAHGRVDDTMNLGGIKVSSAEIERVVQLVPGVREVAAVAQPPPEGGPDQLVVYAVVEPHVSTATLHETMQELVRQRLNPLFKIARVIAVDHLPRTASNKVMRRVLRDSFGSGKK